MKCTRSVFQINNKPKGVIISCQNAELYLAAKSNTITCSFPDSCQGIQIIRGNCILECDSAQSCGYDLLSNEPTLEYIIAVEMIVNAITYVEIT